MQFTNLHFDCIGLLFTIQNDALREEVIVGRRIYGESGRLDLDIALLGWGYGHAASLVLLAPLSAVARCRLRPQAR